MDIITEESLDKMSDQELQDFILDNYRRQQNGEKNNEDFIFDSNEVGYKTYLSILGCGTKQGFKYKRKIINQ